MDLVKKKSIAIRLETYARLTRLAAELKLQRLDGGMVSLDMAVDRLLNLYDAWREGQEDGAILESETAKPGVLEQLFQVATPEQLEDHDKRFIHQYPGGGFDMQKAVEYVFGKPVNKTE
jgi:hypothetical protein